MKRIILAAIIPFVGLMFIWLVIGYIHHGDNILSMHLDLEKSLSKLTNYNYEFQLIDIWNTMVDRFLEINTSEVINSFVSKLHLNGFVSDVVQDLLSGIRSMLNPLALFGNLAVVFGGLLDVLLDVVYFIIGYVTSVFNFVFNPVFV